MLVGSVTVATFSNRISPANFGIVAMCAGLVMTCADTLPASGARSRHSTIKRALLLAGAGDLDGVAGRGRVPRNTATTVRVPKSTFGTAAGAGVQPPQRRPFGRRSRHRLLRVLDLAHRVA